MLHMATNKVVCLFSYVHYKPTGFPPASIYCNVRCHYDSKIIYVGTVLIPVIF